MVNFSKENSTTITVLPKEKSHLDAMTPAEYIENTDKFIEQYVQKPNATTALVAGIASSVSSVIAGVASGSWLAHQLTAHHAMNSLTTSRTHQAGAILGGVAGVAMAASIVHTMLSERVAHHTIDMVHKDDVAYLADRLERAEQKIHDHTQNDVPNTVITQPQPQPDRVAEVAVAAGKSAR